MSLIKRSDILCLLGATSLLLSLIGLGDGSTLITYAVIFFTGSIITGAIENKK